MMLGNHDLYACCYWVESRTRELCQIAKIPRILQEYLKLVTVIDFCLVIALATNYV